MIVLAMMTQTVADDNDNIIDDDDGDDSKGSDDGIDDVDLHLGTVLLLPSVHVIDVSSSRRRRPGAGNSLKVFVIVIGINIVIAIVLKRLVYVDHKKHNGILKVVVMAPCVEVGHLPHELVHVLNIFAVDGHLRRKRRIKKYSQHLFCQIGGKLDCVSCVNEQKDV